MRYEPPADRAGLIAAVRERYGISARDLAFVSVGFVAACYVVHCSAEEPYLLKLWPELRLGQAAADRQCASLVLTRAIHNRHVNLRVPYPIPTRDGALWGDLAGTPFAVFPLLPGKAPPARTPAALRDEFARTIAAIHRATPALIDVLPPREAFAIPDERGLRRCLAVIQCIGSEQRPGLRALRRLLLPREVEIRTQHTRLRQLQKTMRQLDGPFVLCHTDLGGDNMLVDEEGRFSVLDWDDATVAPPEFDLWSLLGDYFERSLAVYREAGGVRPLHSDRFAFYLLRRYLGDMVARLERILEQRDADTTEQEDEELLRGMQAYGFARWAALDDTLLRISVVLQQTKPEAGRG